MITRITGTLAALGVGDATLNVGAFDHEVLVPEFVRRQLQSKIGEEISLRTIEYLEGNPQRGGRMTPRLVGFATNAEREFFELFCSVDGVGVKKALQAMTRPARDVAAAIAEQDVKELSTLPGIGPAVAERIVAKLRRKMTRFALMPDEALPAETRPDTDVLKDGFEALVALGHGETDARRRIERAASTGKKFKSVEDLLQAIYQQQVEAKS